MHLFHANLSILRWLGILIFSGKTLDSFVKVLLPETFYEKNHSVIMSTGFGRRWEYRLRLGFTRGFGMQIWCGMVLLVVVLDPGLFALKPHRLAFSGSTAAPMERWPPILTSV